MWFYKGGLFPLARGSRVRCKRFINVTVTFAIMVEIAFVCKRIFNVILIVDLRRLYRFNVRIRSFK